MINSFVEKLKLIDVEVELILNYPWIYLSKVNGNKVRETFMADHGFTAFLMTWDDKHKWTDRKKVFEIIRIYR